MFNGQESVLWINVRDAFQTELFDMYDELRQSDKFAYNVIKDKMKNHQSVWPEAIWNADAKVKYLDIYLTEKEKYFEMCQGDKSAQRDWWLFNAFKYRDSKYQCGDANEMSAFFRAYAPADMTVVPYQHLWPRVDYTDTYPVTQRSKRNVENVLKCPLDTASDTEIWLRSADRMASFGDLSAYLADTVKFTAATKLQDLILGSSAEGYENHKLTSVELGNNRLISYLNVENCFNLKAPIDLSNCYNLETVKAKGSSLNSITFPIGGHITNLELPGTFTNLTLRNQHNIENFELESYDLINTLWIDDTPNLPIEEILLNTPKLDRVRIVNTTWNVSNEEALNNIYDKLMACGGLDANGNNTASGKAVMTGFVNIAAVSDETLEKFNEAFPELIIVVAGVPKFFVRFINFDGSILHKYIATTGDDVIDPVAEGIIDTPSIEATEDTRWQYKEWSNLPQNIQKPQNIVALYTEIYRVRFFDGNNNNIYTEWVPNGAAASDPVLSGEAGAPTKTSDAQYIYAWIGWNAEFDKIVSPIDIQATFNQILRQYNVRFRNSGMIIQDTLEYYGTYATFNGDETAIKKIVNGTPSDYYEFAGWSPDLSQPITGPMEYNAQFVFVGYIDETWDQIIENVNAGNIDAYGLCGRKIDTIEWTFSGQNYSQDVEFEIIGVNHDELEDGSKASLTFRAFLKGNYTLNTSLKYVEGNEGSGAYDSMGWYACDMRTWLNNEDDNKSFINALPEVLKNSLKATKRISDNGSYGRDLPLSITYDKIALGSLEEYGLTNYSDVTPGQGEQYPIITDDESRKFFSVQGVDIPTYWTRTTGNGNVHQWYFIDMDGRRATGGGANYNRICILFSI